MSRLEVSSQSNAPVSWCPVGYFVTSTQGSQVESLDTCPFVRQVSTGKCRSPLLITTNPAELCIEHGITIELVGVKVSQIIEVGIGVGDITLYSHSSSHRIPGVAYYTREL